MRGDQVTKPQAWESAVLGLLPPPCKQKQWVGEYRKHRALEREQAAAHSSSYEALGQFL